LVSASASGAILQPGDAVRIDIQRAFWFDAAGKRIYA
jgi:hypothetical protein